MEHDGVALEVEAGVGVAGEEVELGSWNLEVVLLRLEVEAEALRFGLEEESCTWFGQLGCQAQFFYFFIYVGRNDVVLPHMFFF